MSRRMVISSSASISTLGHSKSQVERNLFSTDELLSKQHDQWVGKISLEGEQRIQQLIASYPKYKFLDRTAILAIFTAQEAFNERVKMNSELNLSRGGVNIGSSRGATELFEKRYAEFRDDGKLPNIHTSPVTTLGAVSSWVGRALNLTGPAFSHSVTCSTSLYAIGNAMAWIGSGMADYFIAGGSEAPLTTFTIDQMRALKIYTRGVDEHPSRPLGVKDKNENTMVLGEGSASFFIESEDSARASGIHEYLLIEGIGFANEDVKSPTSISTEGLALQQAMRQAIDDQQDDIPIDLVIAHAPGTVKGDEAELIAVEKVFGKNVPIMNTSKWKTGHLLGASAALSIEQAWHILKRENYPEIPYDTLKEKVEKPVRKVMINSIGFGGNAGSIILTRKALNEV